MITIPCNHRRLTKGCKACELYERHEDVRAEWKFAERDPEKPKVSKGCGNCHRPPKAETIALDRVVVVNLKRRPDRLEQFRDSAKILPWVPQVFDAVDASRLPTPQGWKGGGGAWGCLQSHRQLLERAILDGVNSILVLEDDAEPVPDFPARWREFCADVPTDWEMLLLGGQHRIPPQPVGRVVKCFNTVRTHAYALRGQMLKDMYAFWCGTTIDTHLDNLAGPTYGRRKVYAPEPFLFIQSASRSDITGREEPPRSWSRATGDEPLLYLTSPRQEIDRRRESGEIHTGYDRDPETGVDRGLIKMFVGGSTTIPELRKWIDELQSEAVAAGRTLAFWYPGVDPVEALRHCWKNVREERPVEYHSKEAFEGRMRSRPKRPEGHAVFYHVACLQGWEPIVEEQLRLCHHVGIRTIHCGVVSDPWQLEDLKRMGQRIGVNLKIVAHAEEFWMYERLTLDALHAYAVENPTHAVCYFHTKGVSVPGDGSKCVWRRGMMREVIGFWERNLDLCATYDIVGMAWQRDPNHPHFSGNFWWARCDWIKSIGSCTAHRDGRPDFSWCGMSWKSRFFAETWVGSQPWHHVESLGGFDRPIWLGGLPTDIQGFSW